jgi:hypothetical protein
MGGYLRISFWGELPDVHKRKREFALRIQVGYDSSSDEGSASSREVYLRAIRKQIQHNDMIQGRIEHSTKIFCYAERLADPAPGPFLSPELPLLVIDGKVIEFPQPSPLTEPESERYVLNVWGNMVPSTVSLSHSPSLSLHSLIIIPSPCIGGRQKLHC